MVQLRQLLAWFFMALLPLVTRAQWNFDPKDDRWKSVQPDPDIPFNVYLPHSAKVYGSLFLLPNLTNIGIAGDDLVSTSLDGLTNRTDIRFPLNEIFNATFTNSTLPTLVDGQSGPLPVFDDIWCNPKFFPGGCASLVDVSAAVGIPFGHFLNGGIPLLLQRTIGVSLLNAFNRATRSITPTLVLYLQQDQRLAGTVGAFRHVVVPLLDYQEGGSLHGLVSNFTNLLLWDRLEKVDGPDTEVDYVMENRLQLAKAAAACRAFNGRLPYCDFLLPQNGPPTPVPPEDVVRTPDRSLDEHGFRKEVRVSGFRESCEARADFCVMAGSTLDPAQFDGIYQLVGVDDLGFPLYMRPHTHFEEFTIIHRLYMRVSGYIGPKWPGGLCMIITPNLPDLTTINVQAHAPFVMVLGEPPACRVSGDFPLCASGWQAPTAEELRGKLSYGRQGEAGWFLTRDMDRGCPVPRDRVSGFCQLRLAITID